MRSIGWFETLWTWGKKVLRGWERAAEMRLYLFRYRWAEFRGLPLPAHPRTIEVRQDVLDPEIVMEALRAMHDAEVRYDTEGRRIGKYLPIPRIVALDLDLDEMSREELERSSGIARK